jgi:hypothetical protein
MKAEVLCAYHLEAQRIAGVARLANVSPRLKVVPIGVRVRELGTTQYARSPPSAQIKLSACLTIMLVASSLWSIKAALTTPQRDALVRRSGVSRNLFERCISAAAVVAAVLHAFVSAYVVTHETYFPRHSQLSIYSALQGSTWTSKTGWTTATPDGCAWSGVTCLGVEIE